MNEEERVEKAKAVAKRLIEIVTKVWNEIKRKVKIIIASIFNIRKRKEINKFSKIAKRTNNKRIKKKQYKKMLNIALE